VSKRPQLKAITIRQPWAWAIIFGGKDIENRTWLTHYRGPLAIHAGLGFRGDAVMPRGVRSPAGEDLAFGAVIGVVDLEDVVEKSRSRWFGDDGYGFVLRNPRPLDKPVRCSGRLGLWAPTPQQARAILSRV
jgi:hypothetical protein